MNRSKLFKELVFCIQLCSEGVRVVVLSSTAPVKRSAHPSSHLLAFLASTAFLAPPTYAFLGLLQFSEMRTSLASPLLMD